MSGHHDIFICHDQASATQVKRLSAALAARGLSAFAHEGTASPDLAPKLATSKCLLLWGSEASFRSRGCQIHLAMAFLASHASASSGLSRLLIINAEPGLKHIYPLQFRSRVIANAPGLESGLDHPALAGLLEQTCNLLPGTLGDFYPDPQWGWRQPFDRLTQASDYFEGREREIWDIHEALTSGTTDSGSTHRTAVISGASGVGKSALASEYAFRFGRAFPGGIFRISAAGARPAIRLRDLNINRVLKPQLLALIRQLIPQSELDETDSLAAIMSQLGNHLHEGGRPFLWVVDDLPEGINGPVLRQFSAPSTAEGSGHGSTLFISRSQRYDARYEPIHLPPLDETAGLQLLTHERIPSRTDEREAAYWLLEELGRHPRFVTLAAMLAEEDPKHRRAAFHGLINKLTRKSKVADEVAVEFARELPLDRAKLCANAMTEALHTLEGSARDILRLAAGLASDPLPLEFISRCLVLGGLSPDERQEDLFTIFLNEPEEVPLSEKAALEYVRRGALILARLGLAEITDNAIRVYPLVSHILNKVIPTSPRQQLLRESALQAIYLLSEKAAGQSQWQPLTALAPHGRQLIGDLRDRAIEPEDSPPEITGRIRLAIHLADLDLLLGDREQAITLYRSASAYLIRVMAIDPHDSERQRDFARIQEHLGDLLSEDGDLATALDYYRKGLGIRTFMAKQEHLGPERIADPLRLHTKISDLQRRMKDPEGALQSQQAAHALLLKMADLAPDQPTVDFDIVQSHLNAAELNITLNALDTAIQELKKALPLAETLSQRHPNEVRYQRIPALAHNRMGDILRARDDLSGALNRYRMGLEIYERIVKQHPEDTESQRERATCYNSLGDTLLKLDDPQEADQHFLKFLEIASQPVNQKAFQGLRARAIAAVQIKLGQSREADKSLTAAHNRYLAARSIIERLAIDHPEHAKLREDLAWLREKMSRISEKIEAEHRRIARNQAEIQP